MQRWCIEKGQFPETWFPWRRSVALLVPVCGILGAGLLMSWRGLAKTLQTCATGGPGRPIPGASLQTFSRLAPELQQTRAEKPEDPRQNIDRLLFLILVV